MDGKALTSFVNTDRNPLTYDGAGELTELRRFYFACPEADVDELAQCAITGWIG